MTKARAQYIYQLKGQITKLQVKKVSPESKYAGQSYYDLLVNLQRPYEHIRVIQVFQSKLTNPTIWEDIQNQELAPQYLFKCRNIRGYYHLVDWEELKGDKD
ncbi:MAG: hypothetical protein MRECE_7c020 [Mycoplasmataceae bacterium CE_OT135]|nr:MAG: hypothetical protein MRECE_7c020 [Mycoplasmataceae bacterium CE_OT135]